MRACLNAFRQSSSSLQAFSAVAAATAPAKLCLQVCVAYLPAHGSVGLREAAAAMPSFGWLLCAELLSTALAAVVMMKMMPARLSTALMSMSGICNDALLGAVKHKIKRTQMFALTSGGQKN